MQSMWRLRAGREETSEQNKLTRGQCYESIDGLLEASISLIGSSGLQRNEMSELWAFSILHGAS